MSGHDEDARTAAREDQARDERDAARYADAPPRLLARLTTAGDEAHRLDCTQPRQLAGETTAAIITGGDR